MIDNVSDVVLDCGLDFIAGGFIGLISWFFGGFDGFVSVLLTFTVIDYLSGMAAAIWVRHNLSSAAGFKGISRKCLMFSFVGIAHVLDKHLLGDSQILRTAVCLFYIGNEGLSIIENADTLGVPFPKMLRDKFLELKSHKDNKKEKKATHE